MTVQELIDRLSIYPGDMEVVNYSEMSDFYASEFSDPELVNITDGIVYENSDEDFEIFCEVMGSDWIEDGKNAEDWVPPVRADMKMNVVGIKI